MEPKEVVTHYLRSNGFISFCDERKKSNFFEESAFKERCTFNNKMLGELVKEGLVEVIEVGMGKGRSIHAYAFSERKSLEDAHYARQDREFGENPPPHGY